MTMIDRYNEHPAPALASFLPHMKRIGAGLSGILGNDGHRYGYHLSAARLAGTGHGGDYSLEGALNRPTADLHAGCAIDIGMGWQAAGEWLEWVRIERAAGRLPEIAELIGDPDYTHGVPKDVRDACYAAPSTGWRWTNYSGEGHVTWCHVGIGRRFANVPGLGDRILGGWTAAGPTRPAPSPRPVQEDDVRIVSYRGGHAAYLTTGTSFHILTAEGHRTWRAAGVVELPAFSSYDELQNACGDRVRVPADDA